jgi:lauroyl/myristoyl acyltransferase
MEKASWLENIWTGLRYFLLFPVISLLPPPFPYLFCRYLSRIEYQLQRVRREAIRRGMTGLLRNVSFSGEELDLATRRYFEVVFCDEIDLFIYLLGYSKRFVRSLKVEGEENLREALRNEGGILLSAHFGGGFWILPFLREKGVAAHFFSADIAIENYPSGKALYYYHRLRMRGVEKASGEKAIFKKGGRQELIRALSEGKWVIILFDVPPFLVKDVMEVPFLGQKAVFPKGIISITKATHVPLLPFFSFLDEGKRRICFERPFFVDNIEEGVKTCVKLIETQVTRRPDHWHLWAVADQFIKNG